MARARTLLGARMAVLAWVGLAASSARGAAIPSPAPAPGAAAAVAAATPTGRPMAFARLVMRLPPGQVWASMQGGVFCLPSGKATWQSGQEDIKGTQYPTLFQTIMTAAGFQVEGDPTDLFEQHVSVSDYEVAGVITSLDSHMCLPRVGLGDNSAIRGAMRMDMEWQVYSTLRKTVVAKVTTHGAFEIKATGSGGVQALIQGAFKDNVQNLAADPSFRTVFAGPPEAAGDLVQPTSQPPLALVGALAAGPRPIAEAVGAVVLIFAGEGHGGGFLVSTDGLLLTDQHVVGEAKYVKIRWPDGIETLGEVIRSNKVRDVALVKTDPRGRKPLRLRRDAPQVGESVFAIGAPLDEKFQNTVTRGVVSANRTFQGLSYLQSDVSVNPGSSGGPLIDETGAAVALTEAGFRIGGAPEGIALFTPVRDALDFLNAAPQ